MSDSSGRIQPPLRTTEIDVAAYREYVLGILAASIADNCPSERILNRNAAHASVIIEVLFDNATRYVELLTGELNNIVYGNRRVIESAVKFLRNHPEAFLRILSERPLPQHHSLLTALRYADLFERVEYRIVPAAIEKTYRYHFAVADGQSFRFENSKDNFEAVVQFREPQDGQILHGIFEQLRRASGAD